MAYFVILSSDANLIESFDQESDARAALERIVQQDPDNADEYALLQYDDDGHPVRDVASAAYFARPGVIPG